MKKVPLSIIVVVSVIVISWYLARDVVGQRVGVFHDYDAKDESAAVALLRYERRIVFRFPLEESDSYNKCVDIKVVSVANGSFDVPRVDMGWYDLFTVFINPRKDIIVSAVVFEPSGNSYEYVGSKGRIEFSYFSIMRRSIVVSQFGLSAEDKMAHLMSLYRGSMYCPNSARRIVDRRLAELMKKELVHVLPDWEKEIMAKGEFLDAQVSVKNFLEEIFGYRMNFD